MKKTINIPKTFFGFLIASVLFWILINLSKTYTTEVIYDVNYTNLPQQKTIIATPLKNLTLTVKGSGFKLISTNISKKPLALDLNNVINKNKTDYYFLSKRLATEIKNKLKSGIQLVEIQKDTIPLKIGTLLSKKVPLKNNTTISYKLGYDLAKPITIKPDSVLISGDKFLLEEISYLPLEKISLENISETTKITTDVILPKNGAFKTNITTAEINIEVDKFTEGEIEVPVIVKNAPKEINIFPKKVKLIYKVGLTNFNKIDVNSFTIECDYKTAELNETSYLIPKLTKASNLTSKVRIVPDKIDFLIHK